MFHQRKLRLSSPLYPSKQVNNIRYISAPGILYGTNVTNDTLDKIINQKITEVNTPAGVQKRIQEKADQDKREKEYIESSRPCPISRIKNLRDHISTIDPKKFKELIQNKFYDPVIMKEAMCVANSLYYPDPSGSVHSNDRIREWIENLKQIGEPSAEGYAMSSGMNNRSSKVLANNLFVIKAPRDPNSDNLMHELFIGLQLNKYRKYLPNITYTYGGFKCTSPVIDTDKEIVSWCMRSQNSVNFVMYENILNSISMFDYLKTADISGFLSMYLQALYYLLTINRSVKYSHNDLHSGNVLIQDIGVNGKIAIPYKTEDDAIEYLITDRLVRIIDNGFSYMEVDGQNYGFFDAIPYGTQYDAPFQIYDAYKLLMWSAYSMKAAGNINYVKLEPLFRFFNKTDLFDMTIEKRVNTSFGLPFIPELASIKLEKFLRYLRQQYPQETNQILLPDRPSNIRILGCDGTDICYANDSEVVSVLGLDKPLEVNSVIHLYDIATRLQMENRLQDLEGVFKRFNLQQAINDGFSRYNGYITRIDLLRNSVAPVRLQGVGQRALILNTNLYKKHEEYVIKMMEIWDIFHSVLFLVDAFRYLFSLIPEETQTIKTFEENYANVFLPMVNSFTETLNLFAVQAKYLMDLDNKNKNVVNQAIKKGSVAATWYWITYPIYFNIISQT